MRFRCMSIVLLSAAFAACSNGAETDPDPSGDTDTNKTVPELQKAATDDRTPKAQRRSY